MTKKFSMISEAQVRSTTNKEVTKKAKEIQGILGECTLAEAIKLVESTFNRKITQKDYNEWLRQVVLQAEFMRDEGKPANLNKRSQFNDIFNEVIENDPAGKVSPGDLETFVSVSNILWGMYKQSKDHVRVNKAMRAREEEEAVYGGADDEGFGVGDDEAGEVGTAVNDDDDYRNSDLESQHAEDLDRSDAAGECPYDERTPEYDAWMAGFAAAQGGEDDVDPEADMDPAAGGYDDDDEFDEPEDDVDAPVRDEAPVTDEDPESAGRFEDEEADDYTAGYSAAKREYRTGIKASHQNPSPRWELGYEDFMRDTEGQRGLARHEVEDEERKSSSAPARKLPTLKDVLSGDGGVMKQELKRIEREGADTFRKMSLPANPHPHKSLAKKAWARGFKNAAKSTFGFFDKPAVTKPPVRKKK